MRILQFLLFMFITSNSFAENCLQYGTLYDDLNAGNLNKWTIEGSNFAENQDNQAYLVVMSKSQQEIGNDVHGVDLIPNSNIVPQLIQADLTLDPASEVSGPDNGIGVRLDGIFFRDGVSDIKASIGVDKKLFENGEKEVIAVHLFRDYGEGIVGDDIVPWQVIREHDGQLHTLQMFWNNKTLYFSIDGKIVFQHTPPIKLSPNNPKVKITAFAFPMSITSAYVDNVYIGDKNAAIQTAQCYTQVERTVKTEPQIIMAGFDPMLIDKNEKSEDSTVRVVSVVEEGANPIRNVYLKLTPMIGQANLYFGMTLKGKMPLDKQANRYGLVYETELYFNPRTLPIGSIAQEMPAHQFFNLFGYEPMQFSIIANDGFDNIVSYPYFSHNSYPAIPKEPKIPEIEDYQRTVVSPRTLPQVIMAGFTPLVGFDENIMQFMAVVRKGSADITDVTLRNLADNSVIQNLSLQRYLPNNDALYAVNIEINADKYPEGTPEAGSPYPIKLWNVWNDLITIEVRDENGNTHRFADVIIDNYLTQN